MGLLNIFGNIGSAITKAVITPIGNAIGSGLNAIAGKQIYAQQTSDEVFGNTAGKIYQNVLGGAVVATTAAIAGPAIAAAPLKTQVIAGAATIVAGGAIASSSKTADALIGGAVNAPSALANFGSNVGNIVENPTISNIVDTFKENPLISGAVVGGAALAIGGGVSSAIATVLNTKAVRQNTEATIGSSGSNEMIMPTDQGVAGTTATSSQPYNDALATGNAPIPTAPATTTISTGKKARRKGKAKQNPTINNKIALVIQNKSVGAEIKRNIKEVIYA